MVRRLCVGMLFGIAAAILPGGADAAERATCFARVYDRAHLAAHPRQRVEAMRLRPAPVPYASWDLAFRIGADTFAGTVSCRGSRCVIEGDGGLFTLQRVGLDLRLVVGSYLSLEGSDEFSPDLARSEDDRVFRLRPVSPAACAGDGLPGGTDR